MLDGRLTLAVSNEILFEYEEVTVKLSGSERWRDVEALLELLNQLHGNVHWLEPQFRFAIISQDPDDNKFCDCAIAAGADFVVTDDAHFAALKSATYKPKPVSPDEFIRVHLGGG